MREYIIAVLSAAALLAILSFISYKSECSGRRLAFAVLFIWVCFVPLAKEILNFGELSLPSFDIDLSDFDEDYKLVAEGAFADGVRSAICEKFSLNDTDVRILTEGFDFEKMKASRIRVILSGRAALADYKNIEKYIEDEGLGECECEIEIGK